MVIIGWVTAILLWSVVWWAGHDAGYPQFRYNPDVAAQYAALAPIGSALAIAWLIYAVHTGHSGEFINNLQLAIAPAFIVTAPMLWVVA